jgi:hypothetical protein
MEDMNRKLNEKINEYQQNVKHIEEGNRVKLE